MKNLWLIGIALFNTVALQAQSTDLDRFSFTVSYRDLPRLPIDSSYHTYDFKLETGPLMKLGLQQEKPEESLVIEGWRQLEADGHITVELKMEDLIILKSDIVQREEIKKDKNGNITGKRLWYAPVLTYNYAARVLVKDHRGKQLQQYQLMSRESQHQYKGLETGIRSEAANIFLNIMVLSTQLSRDVLMGTINRLSYNLTDQYGYAERRVSDQVWILDSRKHPEYDDFRANWATIKNALFRLNPNDPVDEVRKEVKPAIAYFEKIRKQYSGRSKSQRKLRYASHFLLAKLYYYLDDPDMAIKEATDLVLNDYDSRDGRSLEAAAAALKQQLIQNKRSTRHFPLDVYALEGPRREILYSGQ